MQTPSATPESLRTALDSGLLPPADYVKQAREVGVDAATVASAIKAIVVAKSAGATSAPGGAAVAAPTAEVDVSSDAPVNDLEAALAWLRSRPSKWGMRAAERLGPGNDFLFDLDLYDSCDIDDEGARVIAIALASNSTLTSINLSQNRISDAGVGHLCEALRTNRTVTRLDVGKNAIGEQGAERLVAFVASESCALASLVVCDNAAFFSEEMKAALRGAWGARDAAELHV